MEIPESALHWLVTGQRGMSSETMFVYLASNGTIYGRVDYPYDPDDFQRCEKLLRMVPEFRERLSLMADVSGVWKRLVENWDSIVETFERETPGVFEGKNHGWRSAETYKLMQRVMSGGKL